MKSMHKKSIKLQGETVSRDEGCRWRRGWGGGTSLSLAYALIEIAIHIIFFSCSSDTYFCIWHHNIAGAIVALLPDFVEPVLGLTE